ncbi:MAG: hypothetical protein IH594_06200, partial [Bacteroidales bacterium]|nr:hypothetical protein [Bacteroidales bacterium]
VMPHTHGFPNIELEDRFLRTKHFYYLNYECIFTDDKIVKPLEDYDLIDFPEDMSIIVSHVKFWNAELRDDVLKITCFQPSTKKLLHRYNEVRDDSIPFNWVLLPKDFFKDDLLEFEF